jgi:hypothetical protein
MGTEPRYQAGAAGAAAPDNLGIASLVQAVGVPAAKLVTGQPRTR